MEGYHTSQVKGQQRAYGEVYEGQKAEVRERDYLQMRTEDAMRQE